MKFIYLVRHAEAESGPEMDPTRGLTNTGKTVQIPAIADFLVRQIGTVDTVLASKMARSQETAKPLADALGAPNYEEIWQLDPDVSVDTCWKRVKQLGQNADDILVVSHHPLIGDLLEHLCGVKTGEGTFVHAGVACVHVPTGHLKWFVNPALVERDELAAVNEALSVTREALELIAYED